jgi:hypothetical protein
MSQKEKKWINTYSINIENLGIPSQTGTIKFPSKIDLGRLLFSYDYSGSSSETILMSIPTNLGDRIIDFANGTKGFPSKISSNFSRMFYLSAATITTLGFGDIVPITTTARTVISIESILGIVVVGLFLNALSYERANKC